MALFEYLAIAFSLVLSVCDDEAHRWASHAMRPSAPYWVHLSAIAILLMGVVQAFWAFWSYRDVVWNMQRFLGIIVQLGVLYFAATTLGPDDAGSVGSWRDHYYSVRVRMFGAVTVAGILTALNATVLVNMPLDHPGRLVQIGLVGYGIVLTATANPRVHEALLGVGLVTNVAYAFTIMATPGYLAR